MSVTVIDIPSGQQLGDFGAAAVVPDNRSILEIAAPDGRKVLSIRKLIEDQRENPSKGWPNSTEGKSWSGEKQFAA
ncbi:MAG: hypothetical protein J5J00_06555 [Deltaproteobacteria bacterium]|nr:hypothetical protein [Deltaproteobacteria bacterium]